MENIKAVFLWRHVIIPSLKEFYKFGEYYLISVFPQMYFSLCNSALSAKADLFSRR